jgi:hypothetical protein
MIILKSTKFKEVKMKKYSETMGLLTKIEQNYVKGNLTKTIIVIKTDKGTNDYFQFLGRIPDSLLGKKVYFKQWLIEEKKRYYHVRQTIMNFKLVDNHLSTIPKKIECERVIKARGKLAKRQ